jgi:hypothetical protein
MKTPLRFLVEVTPEWHVRIRRADTGVPVGGERALRRLPNADGGVFPLPPTGELEADPAAACVLLATGETAAIAAAYRQVVGREGRRVQDFGRYLFDTLLGAANWAEIDAAAKQSGARHIELALCWADGERDLHRLNWEMMSTPDRFLAAGSDSFGVAITRVVAGTRDTAPRALGVPPRVLFVVGTSLTDPEIRPAAELIGLMRRLRRRRRRIHSRLLEHASPDRLREAMDRFHPDVVHFICHGGFDVGGTPYLELEPDERDGPRRRPASQLLEYLECDGALPAIVVLSACHTASTPAGRVVVQAGAHETAPMATELIHGGIPVVLGMAGRVSDRICRLFTRGFGEALAEGEPLVTATAHARRVGFADGPPPHSSVDWGFPALFLAEGVSPDYRPVTATPDDPAVVIDEWITGYELEDQPVFCGRDPFVHACSELFAKPGETVPRRQVLAIYVPPGGHRCGRTRLLQELAIQSLHDGHVPVLVKPDRSKGPPTTVEQLGGAVLDAIARVRGENVLDLGRARGQLDLMRRLTPEEVCRDPGVDPEIAYQLESREAWTATAVRRAIQLDLERLQQDARAAHVLICRASGQVVLLLDEVEKYATALTDLFESMLNGFGLGSRRNPIPVVLTFALGSTTNDMLLPIAEQRFTKPWLHAMALEPFKGNGEDLLAYELVLLNPYKDLADGIADRAWAFNSDIDPDVRERWQGIFRKRLRGLPDQLGSEVLYVLTELAQSDGFVVEADDESLLKRMPLE